MPVLRSRNIPPPPINPTPSKTQKIASIQSTDSPTNSPNFPSHSTRSPGLPRRRSLRLASASNFGENGPDCSSTVKRRKNEGFEFEGDASRAKRRFQAPKVENEIVNHFEGLVGVRVSDSEEENMVEVSGEVGGEIFVDSEEEDLVKSEENECLSLRSGTRTRKRAQVEDEKGKGVLIENPSEFGDTRRFTPEEKGKGKLADDFVLTNGELDMVKLERLVEDMVASLDSIRKTDEEVNIMDDSGEVQIMDDSKDNTNRGKNMREQFKDMARRNATRFAHFNAQEDEQEQDEANDNSEEDEPETPMEQSIENIEDWPGPFSTAMKIIRDRENNLNEKTQKSSVENGVDPPLVAWTPRKERDPECVNRALPSLQDLCLGILAKNVDAITSLDCVPDVLRNKLSQMICDSRRMNLHFLNLLIEGSPSEVRLADCSWLEEDQFEKSFENFDTSNLTVFQLDLCGHCMTDSSLLKSVIPKKLSALTALSLKGACRVSDVGLSALLSSAPALRSVNLSQCSLLTDAGISNVCDTLGPILRELYLDDCSNLNAMHILPSLKGLSGLEVLSLRGIDSVSDKFVKKLMNSDYYQNLKVLNLANCGHLTDSSLKVISEYCSQLSILDLSHLRKLTDIGMAYLANGCRGIHELTLCRNAFSDEAVAAFLEASGQSLRDLSLNNIVMVGQNTTISLARRCKNLESLDLSWCRKLTDEAFGLIADSCLSLRVLKLFGCTQVGRTFLEGHSNPHLQVIGLKMTPILEHMKRPDFQQGPLHYSAVPSATDFGN